MVFKNRKERQKDDNQGNYNTSNPQEEVMHGPYVPGSSGMLGAFAMMHLTGGRTEYLGFEQSHLHQTAIRNAREQGRISQEDADKLDMNIHSQDVKAAYNYQKSESDVK